MVLNSQDDPVCHIDNFAPYLPEIQAMQNIAVVTTKREVIVRFMKDGAHSHRLRSSWQIFSKSEVSHFCLSECQRSVKCSTK